jgi:hypothetical protein
MKLIKTTDSRSLCNSVSQRRKNEKDNTGQYDTTNRNGTKRRSFISQSQGKITETEVGVRRQSHCVRSRNMTSLQWWVSGGSVFRIWLLRQTTFNFMQTVWAAFCFFGDQAGANGGTPSVSPPSQQHFSTNASLRKRMRLSLRCADSENFGVKKCAKSRMTFVTFASNVGTPTSGKCNELTWINMKFPASSGYDAERRRQSGRSMLRVAGFEHQGVA